MWLYFALLGYGCLAVVSILDKFILTQEKVRPIVFVFYSTVFLSPLLLAYPFLNNRPNTVGWLVILAGAFGFVSSLWAMYLAFQKSEISHSGPFIGALTPLFVLVLAQIFLQEEIVTAQLIGIFFLSVGTFLISFQKRPSLKDWQTGLNWAMLSAFLFAVFHVSAKYTYSVLGFGNGFVYLWGVMGGIGLLLFTSKVVREQVFPHRNIVSVFAGRILHQKPNRLQGVTIFVDKVLSGAGVLLVQYAISLGSVTKVNALSGAQYGLLVVLVALLSRFSPRVFREQYQKGEMLRELMAVFVIAIGLVFVVK